MGNRRSFLKLTAFSTIAISGIHPIRNSLGNARALLETKKPIVISTWKHGLPANEAAWKILAKNGRSLDAVEAGVMVTESDPNERSVGLGGLPDRDGKVTLDASIMDGKTLQAGAIAGVTIIKNPITTARMVMEKSEHVMMTGKGAETFAKEKGAEIVDPSYFYTETRYQQLQKIKDEEKTQLDHSGDKGSLEEDIFTEGKKFGTVGAVALDQFGNLAAATSTGGMTNKRYGRVGDAPIIGAGTYANNQTCAVSATGHGEYFIRSVVAYDVSALMEYKGLNVKQAAEEVYLFYEWLLKCKRHR